MFHGASRREVRSVDALLETALFLDEALCAHAFFDTLSDDLVVASTRDYEQALSHTHHAAEPPPADSAQAG